MALKVACPQCQKEVIWQSESTSRPFCSERCRLIDLGDWAEENHKISQSAQGGLPLTEEMLDSLEDEFLMNHKFFVEPE
jgi:endogenous inhibitor of DNA gyrase (YacG/DUF329 family)